MLDLNGTFSSFVETLLGVLSSVLQQLFTLLQNLLSGLSINIG
jgi:hypothetical protein